MRSATFGFASALLVLALAVPASARLGPTPQATVLDQSGKKVQLATLLGSGTGTAAIVFYRGHW